MDEIIIELILAIATAVTSTVLTYIRAKYAGFGDQFFVEMKKVVEASKAAEVAFPAIKDLNVKLQAAYDESYAMWVSGEFSNWQELQDTAKEFWGVYTEIQKIIASLK